MRRLCVTLFLLFAATRPVPAPAQSNAENSPAANDQPFATDAGAVATIKDYLGRMKISCTTNPEFKYPVLDFTSTLSNATHQVRIVVDGKHAIVYVFLNRYLTVPDSNPHLDAFLRELMKKNWDLNIGKFERDPSDGEVRYSYCFTTENGIGFEAFRAIVATLLSTGDKLLPDLRRLAETGQATGSK